ncbi:hypothetical protein CLV84_1996 [Neolewinella xylanilytica]|uniref:Uncharacterized protein n=1 Tax=Neolewinella xylanilytica TaxID=1514080 RepID=A0A2S6I1P6_9BACT|nr:hypothetical protein [Neolewinella xylanilytica]PPK85105.1 hypothetical protein CLV84_1996 [Neolewinella xylanilytica]
MNHDKLEDFIHRNREEFDGEMPPAGLWDRVEASITDCGEEGADPLASFIAKNRDAFDLATPPPKIAGALFEEGSLQRKTARRRRILSYALGVAASLLLLFTVYRFGNATGFEAGQEEQRVADQLEKMNPELAEAERFYQSRIQSEFTKVKQVNNDPQLLRDLAHIDEATAQLRADLLQVPVSQRPVLVNQLISTYRTKLDILLRIQQHFPNPKQPGDLAPDRNTDVNES